MAHLDIFVLCFWIVTFFLYLLSFKYPNKVSRLTTGLVFVLNLAFHVFAIVCKNWGYQYTLINTIFDFFSGIAVSIASIYFFIELKIKNRSTGFLIIFIIIGLHCISFIPAEPKVPFNFATTKLFLLHVWSAMVAYAAFTLSAVYSLFYLYLFATLKQKKFGLFFHRMLSLEELNHMNIISCIIGFLLFTFSLVLGNIWRKQVYGNYYGLDIKIILSCVAWCVYAAYLVSNLYNYTHEKKRVYLSLIGFLVTLCSFIASRLFTRFHNFYY